VNQLAQRIVEISTGQVEDSAPTSVHPSAAKRGTARAESLTPAARRKIAKKAAKARWDKKGSS
jgi:hypothetical protein